MTRPSSRAFAAIGSVVGPGIGSASFRAFAVARHLGKEAVEDDLGKGDQFRPGPLRRGHRLERAGEVGGPVRAGGELGEGDPHSALRRPLNDQVKVKRATTAPSGDAAHRLHPTAAGSPVRDRLRHGRERLARPRR